MYKVIIYMSSNFGTKLIEMEGKATERKTHEKGGSRFSGPTRRSVGGQRSASRQKGKRLD
jgi:hypothetical protein